MVKLFFISLAAFTSLVAQNCKKAQPSQVYKGRLEINGICANYTVKLLEGDIDSAKIVGTWVDEVTKKTHTNVFALANPCNFPTSIKEGDTFSFTIDNDKVNCIVCQAYYPTPPKALSIKVVNRP